MAPCERCGTGTRRGRGKGWCSNVACREAEKKEKEEEKEAAKRSRQEERQRKGAGGQWGPCQVQEADEETLQCKHANEHGKPIARRRAPVNEDPAQAKALEDDQPTVRRSRPRSLRREGSIRWG